MTLSFIFATCLRKAPLDRQKCACWFSASMREECGLNGRCAMRHIEEQQRVWAECWQLNCCCDEPVFLYQRHSSVRCRHIQRALVIDIGTPVISELFLWLTFDLPTGLPPTPISTAVIYRIRNDRSFRVLDHSSVFLPSFCKIDMAVQRRRLKPYYTNKN